MLLESLRRCGVTLRHGHVAFIDRQHGWWSTTRLVVPRQYTGNPYSDISSKSIRMRAADSRTTGRKGKPHEAVTYPKRPPPPLPPRNPPLPPPRPPKSRSPLGRGGSAIPTCKVRPKFSTLSSCATASSAADFSS
eukprot:gb/GECG01011325.1/.p1 GENE.gb/GECG01011325.1/~~gb/GECG01011325.1/.p1  ORF type:complete len:135 (+),score=8.02 gb/GECG01011325.1/:1-405(+)